jgi:hypothetical protein
MDLPTKSYSVPQFCETAQRLLAANDIPSFIRFVIRCPPRPVLWFPTAVNVKAFPRGLPVGSPQNFSTVVPPQHSFPVFSRYGYTSPSIRVGLSLPQFLSQRMDGFHTDRSNVQSSAVSTACAEEEIV